MNTANYQELIDELEVKGTVLQRECKELRETLNSKSKYLNHVLDTITVLKGLIEIESADTPNIKSDTDYANRKPVTLAEAIEKRVDNNNKISAIEYNEQNQSSITLNDGVEKILLREGKPLHADKLVDYLRELGRFTDKRNLNSGMLKDSKNRFILLGGNVFDLRSRHSESLFPDFSSDAANGNTLRTPDFVLTDAVRAVIKELNGKEFIVSEIFDTLQARFPSEVNESRRRSVGSTINNLMLKGELEKVRAGSFDKPAIFKAANNG